MMVPRPESIEVLVRMAHVIVLGTISVVLDERYVAGYGEDGKPTSVGEEGGTPYTDYEVSIERVLKDDSYVEDGGTLVLRMLGHLSSQKDGVTLASVALPQTDARYLFALGRNPDGTYGSGSEGLIDVDGETVAFADGIPFSTRLAGEEFVEAVSYEARQAQGMPGPTGSPGVIPDGATPDGGATPGAGSDMTEVQAPIEMVEIWIIEGNEDLAQLVIVSGIPNGCVRYHETVVSQEGGAIASTVTNLVPADDPYVACTQVYGTNQSHTDLSSDFDPCETYPVQVNGAAYAVQPKLHRAVGTGVRRLMEVVEPSTICAASQEPAGSGVREHVPASIEDIQINVAESFPVQYFVAVSVGLPNACYDFGEATVERDGSIVRISVTNLAPADPNRLCAEIYRTIVETVALGSDFDPNVGYTVEVNGKSVPLNPGHPGAPVPASGSDAAYGSPITLTEGGGTSVGNDSLVVVLESIEDSRCPANVVCIWQGQATITVSATLQGESLGQREITLEPGQVAPATADLGGFQITFVSLEPYPGTEGQSPSQPTATLIVQPAPC
jgi:hypothetical protein